MCHRSGKPSAMELPPSCRAAADRMEQALRAEDTASYTVAQLSGTATDTLTNVEKQISKELGKDIVLVAYESR